MRNCKMFKLKKFIPRYLNLIAVALGAMLFMSIIEAPSDLADQTISSIATAALIISAVTAGWLFYDEEDRSASIGFSIGLPLGFFYHQNRFGVRANMLDLSTGSASIMATAAIIAILASAAAWYFKYRKNTSV